ncbi:potassium channel family protein [Microbacterium sp. RD1]|uniref:potassium channel family protein n=1 Tax=Microbacterium sp. RD1 TaxID=3457313 RepID=UPI003FA5D106
MGELQGGRDRGETRATRRWESATFWPLTVAALAFLVAYTFQVIGDLQGPAEAATAAIVVGTWALFVADYLVRLALSHPRGVWFRAHLFDVAMVLVPTLRPVRLLGALTRLTSFTHSAASSLRARLLIYGAGAALLLIWSASLLVLEAERHAPGANITRFGDAVWWAFCTVTTVGYGDYTPVTVPGRITAVFLMVGGVVLVGLVVASFSSWVAERATRGHEEQRAATKGDVDELVRELQDGVRRPDPKP